MWRVGRDQLLDLLQSILKQGQIPHLKVFPKGIPVVDGFEVVFAAGSAKQ